MRTSREFLLRGFPLGAVAVKLTPLTGFLSNKSRHERRLIGQRRDAAGGHAHDLRMSVCYLAELKRLVVDEGNGVKADVKALRDHAYGTRFWAPPNLGIDKIIQNPKRVQALHRDRALVSAGDRVQDAALVEGADDLNNARPRHGRAVLEQYPVPYRVVEIPHHTLDTAAPAPSLSRRGILIRVELGLAVSGEVRICHGLSAK